ncbi:MAG TPA: hypothetical protein VF815_45110 [Myxococcaceae bacterium]|jgi:hypothetical protein
MGLRELKEAAHQQYVKGKFAECMKTYQKVLRLAPRDPNMRVRHAEACRRAGERMQAIASYREAAHLLLELGCETRARGALKAALELDPQDPVLKEDVARLTPQASALDDAASMETTERVELPPHQPLDEDTDPFAPHALLAQQPALPPIQRALPVAPSVPPVMTPVVLPAPGMRSAAPGPRTLPPISRTRPTPTPAPVLAREAASVTPPRMANPGFKPQDSRGLPPRQMTGGHVPPVLQPVGTAPGALSSAAAQPPVLQPVGPGPAAPVPVTTGAQAVGARSLTPPPLPVRSATSNLQASVAPGAQRPSQVTGEVLVPPPPPAEALKEAAVTAPPPAPQATQVARARMEVRRLSPNAIAFRGSPSDGWALIRSQTPFELHLVEDLDNLPPELSDFSLDITEDPPSEGASSTMH